eukprot:14885066-Alexandrium_andersonii.AAC.1
MPNGDQRYIPTHQDQPFSKDAARYENKESVYIVSLGAVRPLTFAARDEQGKKQREDIQHI